MIGPSNEKGNNRFQSQPTKQVDVLGTVPGCGSEAPQSVYIPPSVAGSSIPSSIIRAGRNGFESHRQEPVLCMI